MKKKKTLLIIFSVILFAGIIYLVFGIVDRNEQSICTMEVKICPDGSFVGRIGPDCEFAECPLGNNQTEESTSSSFGNDYMEKSITDYLLTQKYFSWKITTDSCNFCVIENLNPENTLFPLYVWVRCGEFILQDGKLKELSGKSVPIKINYPNHLSFYDISKFSYEVPGNGSLYLKDIKTIFPPNVQDRITDFNITNLNEKIEMVALNSF